MKDYIEQRVLKHARMYLERNENIRSVAKLSGWSKNTVDRDLRERLPLIHPDLSNLVQNKIKKQREIRTIKGGITTKDMWEKKKNGHKKIN
jgi:putative DeoR family transcriptional regulator (stage III sporulation protein D)